MAGGDVEPTTGGDLEMGTHEVWRWEHMRCGDGNT